MKIRTTTIIIAAAAVLLVSPLAEANNFRKRLMSGEIMVTSVRLGGGVKAGRAMALVNASPELLYKVITNVQFYRHFVPRMTESYRVAPGLYHLKTDLPWPVKDAWARVKMKKGRQGGAYVVTWSMQSGTFKKFEGTAWIQQADHKGRSILTYQFLAVPKTIAPDALLTRGVKSVTEDMTFALRDRAFFVANGQVSMGQKLAKK